MKVKNTKKAILDIFKKFVRETWYDPTFDLDNIPEAVRISMVQDTTSFRRKIEFKNKKSGKIVKIPYIEGATVKRMINFVTCWRWGCESIDVQHYYENGGQYEACVLCCFWYFLGGERRKHTCLGSFRAFANPATSKFAVLQMAQTNAVKTFARDIFGIGLDIRDAENMALNKIRHEHKQELWREGGIEQVLNDIDVTAITPVS